VIWEAFFKWKINLNLVNRISCWIMTMNMTLCGLYWNVKCQILQLCIKFVFKKIQSVINKYLYVLSYENCGRDNKECTIHSLIVFNRLINCSDFRHVHGSSTYITQRETGRKSNTRNYTNTRIMAIACLARTNKQWQTRVEAIKCNVYPPT